MNTQTITTPDVFKSRVAQRRIDERNMQRFINKIEAALEGAIKKFAVQNAKDQILSLTVRADVDADTFVAVSDLYRTAGWHVDVTNEALILTLPRCPEDEYDSDEYGPDDDDDYRN
jgi:hypothetical protein